MTESHDETPKVAAGGPGRGAVSGWQLQESGPEAYERFIVSALFNTWANDIVEAIAPGSGTRVLDVACGTGAVARRVAAAVGASGHVVAVDVNEAMLATAKRVVEDTGRSIDWRLADAARLPMDDASFDVVFCQQGLQYFADRTAALGEMRRVLAPGGRLAVSLWCPLEQQPFFGPFVDVLSRHLPPQVVGLQRAAFALGHDAAVRELLTAAGFIEITVRVVAIDLRTGPLAAFLPGYLAGTPMAAAAAALGDVDRTALIAELAEALHAYLDEAGLAVPVESLVVTATL